MSDAPLNEHDDKLPEQLDDIHSKIEKELFPSNKKQEQPSTGNHKVLWHEQFSDINHKRMENLFKSDEEQKRLPVKHNSNESHYNSASHEPEEMDIKESIRDYNKPQTYGNSAGVHFSNGQTHSHQLGAWQAPSVNSTAFTYSSNVQNHSNHNAHNEYYKLPPLKNDGQPYPVDAFPSILRDAINALHEDTQFPVEMIGTTLLAATALALQPLIEVISPFDTEETEPCSLYFLTLAKSGEGKGPIYDKIMAPFNKFATEMHSEFKALQDDYNKEYTIWETIRKGLNSTLQKALKNGGDYGAEELQLRDHLDKKPEKPREFKMFNNDSSPVALIEQLDKYPYAGCFASEAMAFFSGHLKNNQTLLNNLWSNESYPYDRKNKSILLTECRLTILLMTQPSEFERYVQKQGDRSILNGFLARFLITNTVSTKSQRKINLDQKASQEALNKVFEKFNCFLKKQKDMFYDKSIPVKKLALSVEAKSLYKRKSEQYNSSIDKNQRLEHIPAFASKATSNAIRIAALFNCYEDSISESALENAFTITEWHLSQAAMYFYESSEQFQLKQDVYDLFEWIKKRFISPTGNADIINIQTELRQQLKLQQWQPFSKNEIITGGPARLRDAKKLEPVFDQLIGLGVIATICYPPLSALYVAIPFTNQLGSLEARNYSAPYNFVSTKNNVECPLDNYDWTRLRWNGCY
ncbi:TPA: DUF3987 domain-containing protein [Serratia fonticola]